ncbi:putative short-chain dehydrogenase/reductase [Dietzia sp. NCCP-2495]|uniref:mycofactocin-coupled SDR family oxidoreductase n=1 Tax=Dietzia sp. NCCP-2495 TaxID=2934675 RepID=UPI0022326213|nr:mycofactocin-coupled SDR family oxidoreductase [Dietzia sp. NCCP-2495]GLB63415.1 putative short-chain dehydrogenase/reductase [Dietzia sp. NCCP-2495]
MPRREQDLRGRTALVTGAGRGQGRAVAVALARRGAVVWATDLCAPSGTAPYPLAEPGDLDETARLVSSEGGECHPELLDVRDPEAVNDLVGHVVDSTGSVDILVTCAGIVGFAPTAELRDEQWADMIATNLTGTFHCVRAVLPGMADRRSGRIVAISSMSGRQGTPNLAHYSASKWGVIGLIKSVALEYAQQGVTANVVCPTNVDTPMLHNPALYSLFAPDLDNPSRDDVEPRYAAMSPMRIPWSPPEAIADAVDYLVGASGDYVTGSVLDVGMGSAARMP